MNSSELFEVKRHLIGYSAQDYSHSLLSLAGLGSHPCNFYQIVLFCKLHVMNLGI